MHLPSLQSSVYFVRFGRKTMQITLLRRKFIISGSTAICGPFPLLFTLLNVRICKCLSELVQIGTAVLVRRGTQQVSVTRKCKYAFNSVRIATFPPDDDPLFKKSSPRSQSFLPPFDSISEKSSLSVAYVRPLIQLRGK